MDYLNSILLLAPDCSLEELREESQHHHANYTDNIEKYDRFKRQYDENRQHLLNITESYGNVTKKLEMKTYQYNLTTEHYEIEQTNRDDLQRQLKNLNKASVRLNENILQYEAKLKRLTKQRSKVNTRFLFVCNLLSCPIRNCKEPIMFFDRSTRSNMRLTPLLLFSQRMKTRSL